MTYIAALDPNSTTAAADEARVEWFDENLPGWEVRQDMGDRFVTENDIPVEPLMPPHVDDTAAWDAWLEMTYVDPAERAY